MPSTPHCAARSWFRIRMKTIAVVGLSGIGKSTMIAHVRRTIELTHLQASALIKSEQAFRQQSIGSLKNCASVPS